MCCVKFTACASRNSYITPKNIHVFTIHNCLFPGHSRQFNRLTNISKEAPDSIVAFVGTCPRYFVFWTMQHENNIFMHERKDAFHICSREIFVQLVDYLAR